LCLPLDILSLKKPTENEGRCMSPKKGLFQYREYIFQGINISHLGKRKIIFKMPFLGDMLVPWRVHLPAIDFSGDIR